MHGKPVTLQRRARLMVALATVPPLTCADCGALVPLQNAVTVRRGPVCVDLCPVCAVPACCAGATVLHPLALPERVAS
jgi:hypothetical protein